MAGHWIDGPGLARRPDGHARPSTSCSVIPVDVLKGVGTADTTTWELAMAGADLNTGLTCAQSRLEKTLDGYLMTSPGLPLTLVVGGKRLQFASSAPAAKLSKNILSVTSEMFHLVPYGASLYWAAAVHWTNGQPHSFEMDGPQLWPVGCADVIYANGSPVYYMDPGLYASIAKGPPLFCVQ